MYSVLEFVNGQPAVIYDLLGWMAAIKLLIRDGQFHWHIEKIIDLKYR